MAVREYTIKTFKGINQAKHQNSIESGETPDARNVDTAQGNLAVAKGFVKHIQAQIPGDGTIKRLYVWRDLVTVRYVVIAGNEVYAWRTTDEVPQWLLIHTYENITGDSWDFMECKIGSTDYLLIANGETQVIKWDGEAAQAELFGNEEKLSDVPVAYMGMHYSRFFAAGDRENPSRLYWSQSVGDERSIEDWRQDEASENASGGHVEVGDTDTDPIVGLCPLSNQLLIFKRDSIYRLLGDRPGNFRIYRVNAETEPMVNSSCILYGDTPFWMTGAGMYYFDGQTAQPMYNARNIQTFLADTSLTKCKGTENRDRLYFTCRNTEGDAVIVYDVTDRTYMIRDGFQVSDIVGVSGKMFMVNNARYLYRFDEGPDYDGEPIEAYWQTPLTDLNDKPGIKLLQEMYIRGTGEAGAIVMVDAKVGRQTNNHRYLMPEEDEDVLEIPLKNEGRTFSFKFYNEGGSRWTLQGGVMVLFELRQRAR